MHVIELPALEGLAESERAGDAAVVRWSRSFAATTDAEIEDLAMSDSAIRAATNVLERLSADPEAQVLARQRELALTTYKIEMTAARLEGEARGEARGEGRGEAKGEAKGLRIAVEDLCEVLGIPLSDDRRTFLSAAGVDELATIRDELKRSKRWPA